MFWLENIKGAVFRSVVKLNSKVISRRITNYSGDICDIPTLATKVHDFQTSLLNKQNMSTFLIPYYCISQKNIVNGMFLWFHTYDIHTYILKKSNVSIQLFHTTVRM